jgi:transposase
LEALRSSRSKDSRQAEHKKGRTELTAAYIPHDGHVFYRFSEKKNALEIVELLKSVRAKYPFQKLYVILDNHKMHISKDLKRFVYEEDKNIELAYTPKHASWLNAIEQIFASIQKWVLDNSSYQSVEEVTRMIERHLSSLGGRLAQLLVMRPFKFGLKMMGRMVNPVPS